MRLAKKFPMIPSIRERRVARSPNAQDGDRSRECGDRFHGSAPDNDAVRYFGVLCRRQCLNISDEIHAFGSEFTLLSAQECFPWKAQSFLRFHSVALFSLKLGGRTGFCAKNDGVSAWQCAG